ncbi:hypothetical protein [Nonomuraea sp. B19D2]|uniref:hypothetical protein n=1 Tax=Nonomuraea sp. B19D2 TaxID=3159561 RepID=UPI0032DB3F0A
MSSSPINVLTRRLKHVTSADLLDDLPDLPALAEVLEAVPTHAAAVDAATGSARYRRYPCLPAKAIAS